MDPRIKESLNSLMEAVKRSDGATVAAEAARLDGYVSQARGSLHPQLEHFLERRSYAKALAFLGGERDIPAGACGGRAARS